MQYVIIGCSAAGINAIEAIRNTDEEAKIIALSDEQRPLYSRCLISYLLAGIIDEKKIWYREDTFFKDNKVTQMLGVKAEKIDTSKKEVILDNKEKVGFDKLLIATGSSPKLEDIPGIEKKGVFPLRTIQHTIEIMAMLDKVKNVAILGGGLIGLRAAYALKNRGKDVKVFVSSQSILSQIINKDAAGIMQGHIEKKGIKIFTSISAKEIKGKKTAEAVILSDGSTQDAQLIIIGKGVSPNIEIAREAGIRTNRGILTDEFLMTDNKEIFAAGDVSESNDIAVEESAINAVWPVACEQGRIAGLNMVGKKDAYIGSCAMNSIEFFGLPVISIGITRPKSPAYKEISRKDPAKNIYKKIVLKDNAIVGATFVNAIDNIGIIGALIKNKADVSGIQDIMLEDYFDYGKVVKLIKDSKKGFKESEFKETVMTL